MWHSAVVSYQRDLACEPSLLNHHSELWRSLVQSSLKLSSMRNAKRAYPRNHAQMGQPYSQSRVERGLSSPLDMRCAMVLWAFYLLHLLLRLYWVDTQRARDGSFQLHDVDQFCSFNQLRPWPDLLYPFSHARILLRCQCHPICIDQRRLLSLPFLLWPRMILSSILNWSYISGGALQL